MDFKAKDRIIIEVPTFGQNTVFNTVCLFVYSLLISLIKNIGFPVEQCQMALWVFLIAYCVWLVFVIQLVLKNQCFFFLMCLSMHHGHSVCFNEK